MAKIEIILRGIQYSYIGYIELGLCEHDQKLYL